MIRRRLPRRNYARDVGSGGEDFPAPAEGDLGASYPRRRSVIELYASRFNGRQTEQID